MFKFFSNLTIRFPGVVLAIWVLILIGALPLASSLQEQLLSSGVKVKDSESYKASEKINEEFVNSSENSVSILLSSSSSVEEKDISMVKEVINSYKSVEAVEELQTDDQVVLKVHLTDGGNAFVADFRQKAKEFDELNILVTGSPAISYDIGEVSKDNVKLVERIGLPIVFLLLLFVFRSVTSALLPIIIGIFSILISSAVLSIISRYMDLSPLLTNVVTMLGLGIAIDYALFITRRFKSELENGNGKEAAIEKAVQTSGKSVFYAGLTVALTLLSLFVPDTLITNSVAIGGFTVVITSVLLSLSLLPVILFLLGNKVNFLKIGKTRESKSSVWEKLVNNIFKRPVLYLLGGILLVSLLIPFSSKLTMHIPVGAFQELPEGTESREGMEVLSDQLGIGNIFPIEILLNDENQSRMTELDAVQSIDRLTKELRSLEGIEGVYSITNWNPQFSSVNEYQQLYEKDMIDKLPAEVQENLSSLLSEGHKYSLIKVIPETAPYTEESRELVRTIRETILPKYQDEIEGMVTGETANGLDIDQKITDSMPLIIGLIILITYVLLLIAFRSIILPIKAILMNTLVTASSVGFIVFMFQQGNLPGTNPAPINVNTPLIMFALLFGLSIDYEVIIISRIKEYYAETGQLKESIMKGFKETAGMINGAASIMIVVFGVFIFAHFQIIRELGTSLAYAILIDVLIVRTILVPSSMYLLGKWNWYFPLARKRASTRLPRKAS
jgi:putative drug exporter of the RND superfamily